MGSLEHVDVTGEAKLRRRQCNAQRSIYAEATLTRDAH